jgi:hypothetical protein
LYRHLESCGRCFNVYREAALYRGIWVAEKRAFESTKELVEAGLQVASGGTLQFAASAAAAVAAMILLWHVLGVFVPLPDKVVPWAWGRGPVLRAVEQVTKRGAFVLPGGEGAITAENGFSYRSGYVPLDDELKASLDEMFEAYRQGDHSEELIYWLIAGHVATGQMKTARELVEHARALGIDSPRIVIVDAIIAYAFGDHGRAERLLRGVLRTDPGNGIAQVDLALILLEKGDGIEARDIIRNIAVSCSDMHIRIRARSLHTE